MRPCHKQIEPLGWLSHSDTSSFVLASLLRISGRPLNPSSTCHTRTKAHPLLGIHHHQHCNQQHYSASEMVTCLWRDELREGRCSSNSNRSKSRMGSCVYTFLLHKKNLANYTRKRGQRAAQRVHMLLSVMVRGVLMVWLSILKK